MIAGLCAIIVACAALAVAQDVKYNYVPGTDFSKYKTLNPSKDPQKNQEHLQKAVAKLMKNYPPPAKK